MPKKSGKLVKIHPIKEITASGAVTNNGDVLSDIDIVVYATGLKFNYAYYHILPVNEKLDGLAFVGESYNNVCFRFICYNTNHSHNTGSFSLEKIGKLELHFELKLLCQMQKMTRVCGVFRSTRCPCNIFPMNRTATEMVCNILAD
jgi:hypothetical protein